MAREQPWTEYYKVIDSDRRKCVMPYTCRQQSGRAGGSIYKRVEQNTALFKVQYAQKFSDCANFMFLFKNTNEIRVITNAWGHRRERNRCCVVLRDPDINMISCVMLSCRTQRKYQHGQHSLVKGCHGTGSSWASGLYKSSNWRTVIFLCRCWQWCKKERIGLRDR
jgi:hypothetical protein